MSDWNARFRAAHRAVADYDWKTAYLTVKSGLEYFEILITNRKDPLGKFNTFPPADTTHVVVHVPGWLAPACVMDFTAARIQKRAKLAVCTFHVGFKSCNTFESLVNAFGVWLRDLFQACPNLKRVDFACHSLGGLVALQAIVNGWLDGMIVRVVTNGSMHCGTPFAVYGFPFSLSAWALHPIRSRFKPKVHYGRLHQIQFLSIAGRQDLIVPPEYCYHAAARNVTVDADHASLLLKKEPCKMAIDFFLAPQPDECPLRPPIIP